MIVCSCNVLSDKTIRGCLGPGPDCPYTPAQVYRCLGCSPQCGRCARTIRDIMEAALPGVHGACTSQCSAKCPLSAHGDIELAETGQGVGSAAIDALDPIEAIEAVEVVEGCGTISTREFAGT